MGTLIQITQLILSLSILVLIHELGHFMFARFFKTRVEKFYLFFNPWFSLFKWKKGDTTYGIGWLPLGGYVKISGMIDESMDRKQLSQEPKPWEFRSKPAWQRFFIMIGGVMNNFILAMIIYTGIIYTWGTDKMPLQQAHHGIYCDSLALDAGFQHGDVITKVGDVVPDDLGQVINDIVIEKAASAEVLRDGNRMTVFLPADIQEKVVETKSSLFTHNVPFVIDSVLPNSIGANAGFTRGDSLVAINGQNLPVFFEFKKTLQSNKNKEIEISYFRNGQLSTAKVALDSAGLLGVMPYWIDYFYQDQIVHTSYSLAESVPIGINYGIDILVSYVKQLKLIFTPAGASSVGGFDSIRKLYPEVWVWSAFWHICAFLSIVLAFMNILPIPALDGGHLLFLIYEMVSGQKPGQKFLERAQLIGMAFLISLMLFANLNDFI